MTARDDANPHPEPVPPLPTTQPVPPAPGLAAIGGYRLMQRLGAGGMGEVFEAEQEHPVRRRVAIKLIRRDMVSTDVVARFEFERQMLALLNHPSIARVYDAGTVDGRPYFVMELVSGIPLLEYCDRNRLSIETRLGLVQQVCEGVQYAHLKGIIHRDLKSSNILVTVEEGAPRAKIIDFGVSKAVSRGLVEHTLHTQLGQVVGTLEYMSPEQAGLTPLDVDMRSDVYSLGVLLYELLVGERPIRATGGGEVEQLRLLDRILTEEPSRPSARVSGMGERARELGHARRIDPSSWSRRLRGDLDWITLKSLEKDRTRRYSSASELSADLGRHLHHEPVEAGPPSTWYRCRKFVRRHRVGVGASAVVALALVAGIAGTTTMLFRARRAERMTRQEAETAKRTSDFLIDLFRVSDPEEARGNTITAREILDRGADRVQEGLAGEPVVQARIMNTMGNVYRGLGLASPARDLLLQSLAIRKRELGNHHPEVAAILNDLSELYTSTGDLASATNAAREALAINSRVLGADHLQTGWSHYRLGTAQVFSGEIEQGRLNLNEAKEVFSKQLGPEALPVAWCVNDLGVSYAMREQYDQALPLFLRATKLKERALGQNHPDLTVSYTNLAELYAERDDLVHAEQAAERAFEIGVRIYGPDHPRTAMALRTLGETQRRAGNYAAAETSLVHALDIFERKKGFNLDVPLCLWTLAAVHGAKGNVRQAERGFLRSIELFEAVDPRHPELVRCLDEYAAMLEKVGRSEDAARLRARAATIRSST